MHWPPPSEHLPSPPTDPGVGPAHSRPWASSSPPGSARVSQACLPYSSQSPRPQFSHFEDERSRQRTPDIQEMLPPRRDKAGDRRKFRGNNAGNRRKRKTLTAEHLWDGRRASSPETRPPSRSGGPERKRMLLQIEMNMGRSSGCNKMNGKYSGETPPASRTKEDLKKKKEEQTIMEMR